MFNKKKKREDEAISLGKGILMPTQRANKKRPCIKEIWWPNSERKAHMFCFGTTRIGKTKLMDAMITQDIMAGRNVAVIDPKGDIELFSKIVQTAFAAKREKDLCLVTPIYPSCSAQIDPLAFYYMPEEIVSHVVSGIKAKEEFFINIAYETTLVIVLSQLLLQKVKAKEAKHINFEEIKKKCSFAGLQNLRASLSDVHLEEAEEIRNSIDQLLGSPPDYFAKISSSLRTVLTALSTGSVGQIIGKAQGNTFIQRLERGEKVIMVVQTGSLLTRRTSHIVARVFVSMLQSYVGRRFASGKVVDPPLCLFLDEFSNIAYLDISDLFNKAGGAGIWIHAFTQSLSDLNAEIGDDHARKILDNTNTKVFMRVNDPKTAEYIADYAGTLKKYAPILTLGGGIMIREVDEPAIKPEDAMELKTRDFYMFSMSGAYRGRANILPPPAINVIYPEIQTA